jgi:hypothetical protein
VPLRALRLARKSETDEVPLTEGILFIYNVMIAMRNFRRPYITSGPTMTTVVSSKNEGPQLTVEQWMEWMEGRLGGPRLIRLQVSIGFYSFHRLFVAVVSHPTQSTARSHSTYQVPVHY